MTSVSFRIGGLACHTVDAGSQRLDGGAMFGVVPKPLWEQRIPADERNRIPLALRCLLIEHPAGPVLVDTGVGNKESSKFTDIYAVENSGDPGPTRLEDSLVALGFTPSDIKYVINTHLHFDHCGGNTVVDLKTGRGDAIAPPRLAFPEATYVVQRGELAFARDPGERAAASYLAPNFEPIDAADRWRLIDGDCEILPGIRALPTPGHVPHHQSVVISDGNATGCFVGDLIPTAAHVPPAWIMGYDLEPLVTLATKKAFLDRAVREDWVLILEHEPGPGVGRLEPDGKRLAFAPLDTPPGAG